MRVLAFWTAGGAASLALRTGAREVARRVETAGTLEALVPAARELLETAGLAARDLDGVAVARGPGSFTGLRVGAAAALGLARGAGISLFSVGTLEVWAAAGLAAFPAKARCQVALDARRGEVYFGTFGRPAHDLRPPLEPRPVAVGRLLALEPVTAARAAAADDAPLVGDARELLLEAGLDQATPGFAEPRESLALWMVRVVAADPDAARTPLGTLRLDYIRDARTARPIPPVTARAGRSDAARE